MANLIVPQQPASADAQAVQMKSVTEAGAQDVSKVDTSTAKGQNLLATKQEFDTALGQNLAENAKKAAAQALAQAKADVKAVAVPSVALPQDPNAAQVAAQQEKVKKQVSDQAAALAQVKASLNAVTGEKLEIKTAQPKQAQAVKQGAQIQNQLQVASAQKPQEQQVTQALVNGLDASQLLANGDFRSNGVEMPGFSMVQDMNYQGATQDSMRGQDQSGVTAFNATQATQKPTAVSSTLSTDDYLNLRSFSGGSNTAKKSSKLSLNTAELGTPGSAAQPLHVRDGQQLPLKMIDAPVTTGSMMRPVLSHDAIHQMTGQLSSMNLAKQDGEIKIRLKPDHLGELSMSVRNHGAQVSIRIQAQDPEAKQIIESSLNSLRDSLSQQNLTVTRLEVTQAPAPTQASAQDNSNMQMDMGQFRQQQSDLGFQQQQQQESNANKNYWRDEESNSSRRNTAKPQVNTTRAGSSRNSNQGLDLIA